MKLTLLAQRLDAAGLLAGSPAGVRDASFGHVTADSRLVRPGSLFVALRGGQADGHQFIDKAVKNGATAILCEAVPADASVRYTGTAFVQVARGRKALALAAALAAGDPSDALALVGVTGTNGKTTTAHLLYHLFRGLGYQAGLVGTVGIRVGDAFREATHTTPDAAALQTLLREMVDAGVTHAAMEVSSHALDQDRVAATRFAAGVFTNVTRDHLDYHGRFEDYVAAKKRLFDMLPADAAAIYNADDPNGAALVAGTRARLFSYGTRLPADVHFAVVGNELRGLTLTLDGHTARYPFVGGFNAYNLAAAYTTGRALGFEAARIVPALQAAPPVPGRFEQFVTPDGKSIIVDYAHTPDALENVLRTARETMPADGRLWVLFGCGGERDTTKRRLMGSIAERYADRVVVTSDNPRREDPEAILSEIRRGMDAPARAAWIVGRREALAFAADHVAPRDVLVVAGKGHEDYQVVGTEKVPFDDRALVRTLFGAEHPAQG